MKKENQTEKKLSLKKLQMAKIDSLNIIRGGSQNLIHKDGTDDGSRNCNGGVQETMR